MKGMPPKLDGYENINSFKNDLLADLCVQALSDGYDAISIRYSEYTREFYVDALPNQKRRTKIEAKEKIEQLMKENGLRKEDLQ